MPGGPIAAELRAAAAAENADWRGAEQSALDAQSRSARVLREIALKQLAVPAPVLAAD